MEVTTQQIDTRWFKDLLSDKRLSQRQLAKRMDMDPAAMSLMLRGLRKMSAAEAAEIARQLGVGVDDVMAHAGVSVIARKDAQYAVPPEMQEPPRAKPAPVEAARAGAGVIDLPVPMSDGSEARLVLPAGLRAEDAERIATLVRALARP